MFGNKKRKIPISKDDIKAAIKKANEQLKASNKRLDSEIDDAKAKLKAVSKETKEANKELKDIKSQSLSAGAELEAKQSQIFTTQCDLTKLSDKFKDELLI